MASLGVVAIDVAFIDEIVELVLTLDVSFRADSSEAPPAEVASPLKR
jgi:hypothetical protein